MKTQPDNVTTRETVAGETAVAGTVTPSGDTDPCHPCHPVATVPPGKRVASRGFAAGFEPAALAPVARSDERDERFFAALENGHPVRDACRAAGYTRQVVYRWRQKDSAFDDRWRAAQAIAVDLLEEEADRRGRDGYMDAVYSMGQLISERRRYSDGLLLARLKALKPELYRERRVQAASGQRQVTIVIGGGDAEELILKLVGENKLSPSDLPPSMRARLQEKAALPARGKA